MLGFPYNKFCKENLTNMENLSASLEDYLEIICNLLETSNSVKAVEVARKLNISRASVSEALTKLAEKELIVYESHKGITITKDGLKKAKQVIEKHNTITAFFESTLGLNRQSAEENACKIEHVIDDEVFERLQKFQKYCSENNKVAEDFKKGYIKTENE